MMNPWKFSVRGVLGDFLLFAVVFLVLRWFGILEYPTSSIMNPTPHWLFAGVGLFLAWGILYRAALHAGSDWAGNLAILTLLCWLFLLCESIWESPIFAWSLSVLGLLVLFAVLVGGGRFWLDRQSNPGGHPSTAASAFEATTREPDDPLGTTPHKHALHPRELVVDLALFAVAAYFSLRIYLADWGIVSTLEDLPISNLLLRVVFALFYFAAPFLFCLFSKALNVQRGRILHLTLLGALYWGTWMLLLLWLNPGWVDGGVGRLMAAVAFVSSALAYLAAHLVRPVRLPDQLPEDAGAP